MSLGRLILVPGGRAAHGGANTPRPASGGGGPLEELYRRYAAAVFGRCRLLLRDDDRARDATQDVFANVLSAGEELGQAASPAAFLLRSTTNHCLNLIRAERPATRAQLVRLAADRHERGIEPESRELVRALLGTVPVEVQEIAIMYFVDELTQAEIAEATHLCIPTIRRRLREFLRGARGALLEAFPDAILPSPEELR